MAAPGLERHRLALLAAREDVGNPRAGTNWAIFAYEKHHDLKLLDSGAGGPDELAGKFSPSSIMYGLCRIHDPGTGAHRVVLISWVGEKTPESQREACAGHLPAIRAFFREASVVLSARCAEEVTQEALSRALARVAPPAPPALARRVTPPDAQELVGTNYRKTNPALEIRRTKRDSFWAQAEREEEQRRAQERRRAQDERRRWERERVEQERREAAERELRCREKEREIEEQRKEQARLEAEERRKEKARWEQQQREHEEAMRERTQHSQSIEKAAEAAVLVSQRPQNPRDFFRQRERSGSTSSPPLPGPPLATSPGARRPLLRYHRSLTESAFIFGRTDPPPSPRPPHPAAFRAVAPHSPPQPQPPLPTSPTGRGTPPWAPAGTPTETPTSPMGREPPTPASPTGTGTPPCAPTGTPTSPVGREPPPPASPPGTRPPPCASLGTPPSPGGAGSPPLGSPIGTGPPPACPSWTPPSVPGMGSPPSPPRSGSPDSTWAEPLPSPPSPPQDEDRPPLDTVPLPSPPAWGSAGLLVGPEEGVPSWDAGTPPRSPSPPSLPQDQALPPGAAARCVVGTPHGAGAKEGSQTPDPHPGWWGAHPATLPIGAGGLLGHNGVGGHEPGGWPDRWEQDPRPGQDEPSDSILLEPPLLRAKPGFALLLACDAPHPPLPGGSSPPAEDEDLAPHTV
ncbi:LOW QUALITY PROTEIN: uncharacterized protein FYW35_000402 [Pterocles gutturalis]